MKHISHHLPDFQLFDVNTSLTDHESVIASHSVCRRDVIELAVRQINGFDTLTVLNLLSVGSGKLQNKGFPVPTVTKKIYNESIHKGTM